jgi:hypothetical protein
MTNIRNLLIGLFHVKCYINMGSITNSYELLFKAENTQTHTHTHTQRDDKEKGKVIPVTGREGP